MNLLLTIINSKLQTRVWVCACMRVRVRVLCVLCTNLYHMWHM